ncbi:family 16 glycosylhydrolase [Oryzifoliimicrobium ureilyticus]|uniref:endo-1,3-1,4-beta-glycanase ExoK n=1 Tax=Oryzifoliimicrobium ureilyticus TaxID=3113724 RepID=UPI0030767341
MRFFARLTLRSLCLFAALGSWAAMPAHAMETGKSFVDNFDTVNQRFWMISDGWNNGAHQNCTWSKSEVNANGGTLKLGFEAGRMKDRDFKCGEIQTRQRYGYGTYEARVKAGTGSGLNSAFFTYIGPVDKLPQDEIDFEVLGKNMNEVQLNQYIKGKGGNEKLVPLAKPANEDFNDFAFVWEPGRLRYYVNGKMVHEVTDPAKVPDEPQKIFLSFWGSNTLAGWMGKFAYQAPTTMEVDRIAYTAPGDKCQFPESVACKLN